MLTGHTRFSSELSLPEILADPIVQVVMASDGITKEEMESLIGAVRNKLTSRQAEARKADGIASGD